MFKLWSMKISYAKIKISCNTCNNAITYDNFLWGIIAIIYASINCTPRVFFETLQIFIHDSIFY